LIEQIDFQDCQDWTSKDAIIGEKENGKVIVMDKYKVMKNLTEKMNLTPEK
jgi:hypothetical protein